MTNKFKSTLKTAMVNVAILRLDRSPSERLLQSFCCGGLVVLFSISKKIQEKVCFELGFQTLKESRLRTQTVSIA